MCYRNQKIMTKLMHTYGQFPPKNSRCMSLFSPKSTLHHFQPWQHISRRNKKYLVCPVRIMFDWCYFSKSHLNLFSASLESVWCILVFMFAVLKMNLSVNKTGEDFLKGLKWKSDRDKNIMKENNLQQI